MTIPTIVEAMTDTALFEPWFHGASWLPWRAVLKAAYALPMTSDERRLFRTLADRDPPKKRVREAWIAAGRRSGKDSVASCVGAYESAFFKSRGRLRPGERAQVQCLAVDRDQAKIVLGYTKSYFSDCKYLRSMVQRETVNGLELSNGIDIVIATNDFRSVRGRSIVLSVFDEVAHWRSDSSSNPDHEVHGAILPGLITVNGMVIGISSPHRKAGLLYDRWREFYGQDSDDVLVVKGTSFQFNPTLEAERKTIEAEIERDPAKGRAEWLAEWRADIAAFIDRQLIEDAVDKGVTVRPAIPSAVYFGFVDPSGGASDSFTLAIAHREPDGKVVLDFVHERRPPFNPNEVVREMAKMLREYRLSSVQGDHYSAGFVQGIFAECGIQYQHSYRDRSAIYADLIPLFTSGNARLLDTPRGVQQLAALERRTTATKDRIDHPDHGHDDVAKAIAGAMTLAGDYRRQLGAAVMPIVITTARVCYGDIGSGAGEYTGGYSGGSAVNPATDTSHWGKW